jgi:hypothetical protein
VYSPRLCASWPSLPSSSFPRSSSAALDLFGSVLLGEGVCRIVLKNQFRLSFGIFDQRKEKRCNDDRREDNPSRAHEDMTLSILRDDQSRALGRPGEESSQSWEGIASGDARLVSNPTTQREFSGGIVMRRGWWLPSLSVDQIDLFLFQSHAIVGK